ncbi:MFS multidrug resistance transporter [Histoplasma capsulatum G186AR]|uniref:MFS multidrug resistance transporter n=1 Tax=Ajellomyces capsulatus TaxID=5037 RepID=A0A8H8CS78_AJECA|nr:MFS multidrug resistance transporter [Histoplasma capsulatum]QSS70347.1 MFS multidrug resistance transporter [Histoplasma capsulatum G186AR]
MRKRQSNGHTLPGAVVWPLLAPIIGGAIAYAWGWRSTQWFLTIYGGVSLLILRFGIPETLASPKKPVAEVEPNVAHSAGCLLARLRRARPNG